MPSASSSTEVELVGGGGGAVEDAQAAGFAVRGGQDRDAQVEVVIAAAHLDAAVVRLAALGNIKAGHDLHGGADRTAHALHALGEGDFLQDAIHAVAQAQRIFERLNVDVRGIQPDGLGNDHVDKPDHAGVLGLRGDVVGGGILVALFRLGDQLVNGFSAQAVTMGDGHPDVGGCAQDPLQRRVQHHAQAVNGGQVRHAAGGQRQDAAAVGQRHDAVAQGHLGRHAVSRLLADAEIADLVERDAAERGHFGQEGFLIDQFFAEHELVQRHAGEGCAILCLAQLRLGEHALAEQALHQFEDQLLAVEADGFGAGSGCGGGSVHG